MILKTVNFAKNIAIFVVCAVLAFTLSMYQMPLSNLTLSIVTWSYDHFSYLLTDTYESESDPVTFFTLISVLIIYSIIIFLIFKIVMRYFKNNR